MSHWKKYDGWDWWRSMWTGVFWLTLALIDLVVLWEWSPPTSGGDCLKTAFVAVLAFLIPVLIWAILESKRQQYPLGLPPLSHLWSEFKWWVQIWWMWKVTGWPFKQRCPQCAGSGVYVSEAQARHGDDCGVCSMCSGTGLIKRQ